MKLKEINEMTTAEFEEKLSKNNWNYIVKELNEDFNGALYTYQVSASAICDKDYDNYIAVNKYFNIERANKIWDN